MANIRPTWDEYFLDIMDAVAKRGTCDRVQVACVIVRDKRILATGYNGAPSGCAHCDDVGHELATVRDENGDERQHCIRTAHDVQNGISNAARFGVALDGSTMYTNMAPCYTCAKMIIGAGIKRVVCRQDYHASGRTKDVFSEAGVALVLLDTKVVAYDNQ